MGICNRTDQRIPSSHDPLQTGFFYAFVAGRGKKGCREEDVRRGPRGEV